MAFSILVPLDGSPFGLQALPQALGLALRSQAAVHLVKVHVAPALPVEGDFDFAGAANANTAELNAEAQYLRAQAEDIRSRHGLQVEIALLQGGVVPALESYIREQQISLVVMTSHGRGGLSRAWFGSVADALVRTANVPVLIVRPLGTGKETHLFRLNHILVPLDGSATAELAIAEALQIGSLFGARFTLLQVVIPPFVLAADTLNAPLTLAPLFSEYRAEAMTYLEGLAAPLRQRGLQVDTAVVVQAQSAAAILEEVGVRQADLIVMCTHGLGGWQRYALGSVSDKVLRAAQVPVLLFRPAAAMPGLPHDAGDVNAQAVI